jgi:hypothetical protein
MTAAIDGHDCGATVICSWLPASRHCHDAAAWLAWRHSAWAPVAVLLASALLVIELLVQIPFIGFQHSAIDLRRCGHCHGGSGDIGPPGWRP